MAGGAGSSSSAKRAKVDKAKEEEDPLVRRMEELVVALKEARSSEDARAERVARRELVTLGAKLVREAEEKAERLNREAKEKAERLEREAGKKAERLKLEGRKVKWKNVLKKAKDKAWRLKRDAKVEGWRMVREAKVELSEAQARTKVDEDPLVRRRNELILGFENARAEGRRLGDMLVREAEETWEETQARGDLGMVWKAKEERMRMLCKARACRKRAILESYSRNLSEARQSISSTPQLCRACADLEAANLNELLGKLPPEMWQKVFANVHQNDLLALGMTCRYFRDTTKDLAKKLTNFFFGKKAKNLNPNRLVELQKSGKMASHSLSWFRWVCDTFEILPDFKWGRKRVNGAVYEGDLFNYAAFQGSVEILRWLMEEKGWELNRDTGWWAATGGSVKVLEYLTELGYEFKEEACDRAARGGHLEAVKFFWRQDPHRPEDDCICDWAAREGRLEVLKCARAQDPPCPWSEMTCSQAAGEGHLDVLKWLRDQDPPCPWNEGTCTDAAWGGHRNVLEWLRDQDPPCPIDIGECAGAAWELISDGMTGRGDDILEWIEELEEDESNEEFYDSDEEY